MYKPNNIIISKQLQFHPNHLNTSTNLPNQNTLTNHHHNLQLFYQNNPISTNHQYPETIQHFQPDQPTN